MKEAGRSPLRRSRQREIRTESPKRFYDEVAVKAEGGGVGVLLDGRPVRTPGKALFVVPNQALAEAIGDEWRGQGPRIDPATMPLTRLANSVIDGVKGHEEAVIGDILNYAGSDLICYRAEGPRASQRCRPGIGIRSSPGPSGILAFPCALPKA